MVGFCTDRNTWRRKRTKPITGPELDEIERKLRASCDPANVAEEHDLSINTVHRVVMRIRAAQARLARDI